MVDKAPWAELLCDFKWASDMVNSSESILIFYNHLSKIPSRVVTRALNNASLVSLTIPNLQSQLPLAREEIPTLDVISTSIESEDVILSYQKNAADLVFCEPYEESTFDDDDKEKNLTPLIFGSVLHALNSLRKPSGNLMLRIVDFNTTAMKDIITILHHLFQEVAITKPFTIHPLSRTKYIICKNFLQMESETKLLFNELSKIHENISEWYIKSIWSLAHPNHFIIDFHDDKIIELHYILKEIQQYYSGLRNFYENKAIEYQKLFSRDGRREYYPSMFRTRIRVETEAFQEMCRKSWREYYKKITHTPHTSADVDADADQSLAFLFRETLEKVEDDDDDDDDDDAKDD
jgi:hypothetical protein